MMHGKIGGLALGLAVVAALAVATPTAAHGNDLDPTDGDVHVHEQEGIWFQNGGVAAGAKVTCDAADVPEPCSADPTLVLDDVCFYFGTVELCVP